jgi:hypothetical protein
MVATPISRRLLGLAIATRLTSVTNATGYLGQIGAKNGLPGVEDTPADPPTKTATDLRVKPYFILFPGLGRRPGEIDLAESINDLDQLVRVTAAGGDVQDVLALVDRIDALLFRWSPTVTGVRCGPLRLPPGYDPPLLTDESVPPTRHYVPLQYRFTAFI